MVYGLIPDVRSLAGIKTEYVHSIKVSTGDGSTTEFDLPFIGRQRGYIVDLAASKTSTITVADIIVYVDGTPVTVSSIDEDKGSVTLAAAPNNSTAITADFKWSLVSDVEVIKSMDYAEEMVDFVIRGNNVGTITYTQEIHGDGVETEYEFEHADVLSLTTVTIDSSVYVENTNYKLIKFPRTDRYWYIKFVVPPRKDDTQAVGSIVYVHGENTELGDRLSNLYAARYLILGALRSAQSQGQFKKNSTNTRVGEFSRLKDINEEIMSIQKFLDRDTKYTVG